LKKSKKKDGGEEKTPKADEVVDQDTTGDQGDDEDPENEEETTKEDPEQEEIKVEDEIAILQNNGVFRRELLVNLKELINVQKINAQALIDLNKLIGGALNGKDK